ncbi:MAG: hypothetical protein ACK4WM_07335 [Thermoflexales bacterium]
MSVQKTNDSDQRFDSAQIQWEQDLRPFQRLPRQPRQRPQQAVHGAIPALISFVLVALACASAVAFINQNRPALNVVIPTSTPVVIVPTNTPFVPPTATPYVPPTSTPPAPPSAPAAGPAGNTFGIGARVTIVGTGGSGLNFRRAPSIYAERIRSLPEGSVYEIVGGPEQADGFTWWQLRDPSDGAIGWGVQNYMQLTP